MSIKIDRNRISQYLQDESLAGGLHLYDCIDSTNSWALAQCKQGRSMPFACVADQQSKGRGRRGRQWLSPPQANIYLSLAWRFELPLNRLSALSLLQGVAVIKALNKVGIAEARLKWPNDVLINGNKIAGILIETAAAANNVCETVIGIGLNYRMPENAGQYIDVRWTDLSREAGDRCVSREQMIALLLNECIAMCKRYQDKQEALVDEYRNEIESLMNQTMNVQTDDGVQLTGQVIGVTASGELRMLIDGQERIFNSAELSLHGTYREQDYADS